MAVMPGRNDREVLSKKDLNPTISTDLIFMDYYSLEKRVDPQNPSFGSLRIKILLFAPESIITK
jgi:hypothetical protein